MPPKSRPIYDLSDRIFKLDDLGWMEMGFSVESMGSGGPWAGGFGFGISNGGLEYPTEDGPIGCGMGIRIGSAGGTPGPSELDV